MGESSCLQAGGLGCPGGFSGLAPLSLQERKAALPGRWAAVSLLTTSQAGWDEAPCVHPPASLVWDESLFCCDYFGIKVGLNSLV